MDLDFWGDLAIKTWINLNPSTQWANRQIEPYRGLPFGRYLHASRPRRARRLSLPLLPQDDLSSWPRVPFLSAAEATQETYDQAQCGLLSKLPLDVRVMIYEYVIGGNLLHLTAKDPKSRMTHYQCKHLDGTSEKHHHLRTPSDTVRSGSLDDLQVREVSGFLPLVVTCRKIYSEAIEILYSSNTFEFSQNFAAFRFLCSMIPPQRLSSLRRFRLHLRIPRHPTLNSRTTRDWQDLWTFLAHDMSGLRTLFLELQMLQPMEAIIETTRDDEAASWVKPMVLMALQADRERGCKVEIETRGVKHEPAKIFQRFAIECVDATLQELVLMTCATLHQRIRVSLSGPG